MSERRQDGPYAARPAQQRCRCVDSVFCDVFFKATAWQADDLPLQARCST